jgi:hypothetical protein
MTGSSNWRRLSIYFGDQKSHCIGVLRPNPTTKIITLWEVFNFVSKVSRLLYEWSSDCWCIWKSFSLFPQCWRCCHMREVAGSIPGLVFIEEMYFHFIGEAFLYSFLRIFRVYLWLHMHISSSISMRRDRMLKRSVVLENRISILLLDTFHLWIFIEFNSLSTFENWWKTQKLLAVNVLTILTHRHFSEKRSKGSIPSWVLFFCLAFIAIQ